ncbi:homeobox protein CDX-4 [Aphelenchoides avenae]|nr:homeobox protein CDX-4 [Aphelenchus avenae]
MSSNSEPSTTEPISNSGDGRRSSGRTPRKVYAEPKPFSFNENQRALMEASFQCNRVLTAAEMKRLAQESGAPENSVRNWFKTRRNKERRSIIEQLANSPAANDDPGNHAPAEAPNTAAADAGSPPLGNPAPNAVGHAAPATPANTNAVNGQETAQARAVRELLRGQMQQQAAYQTPPVAVPQHALAPPPPAKAAGNELVEASGRAMMIRLRQLHKKDPKLFLQAQHAVGNAIFKYEMEVDE